MNERTGRIVFAVAATFVLLFAAILLFEAVTGTNIPILPPTREADLDCSDFPSWEAAQDAFEFTFGDPHRLDGDGDGVACEALKR